MPIWVTSGDYVQDKQNSSMKETAIKAHTIARSLAASLPEDVTQINENKLAVLDKVTATVKAEIDKHVGDGGTIEGLDDKRIVVTVPIDSNGNIDTTKPPVVNTDELSGDLESLLAANKKWTNPILSSYWFAKEDFSFISLDKETKIISFSKAQGKPETGTYSIGGNQLFYGDDKKDFDTFIFTSPQLALSVANSVGDLLFWTTHNLVESFQPINATTTMFAGKELYYIGDDSKLEKPKPMAAQFAFDPLVAPDSTSGTVTIYQKDIAPEKTTWEIVEVNIGSWLPHNILQINLLNERPLQVMIVTNNNGISLLFDHDLQRKNFCLLIDDKSLSDMIMSKWESSQVIKFPCLQRATITCGFFIIHAVHFEGKRKMSISSRRLSSLYTLI